MERLLVIKIGGNIIDDERSLSGFLKDFSSIQEPKVLVHGGGKLATGLAEKLNIPQQMMEGRRVTDDETLKIIIMVYSGYINKTIVARLQGMGCNAIGLSGMDGDLIRAHKRVHPTKDYGWVGDIDSVNPRFMQQLLVKSLTPVIAPVTHDGAGQALNTNADTIASSIAVAMSKLFHVRLIYCFEKKGVLQNLNDENSVIPLITPEVKDGLLREGKISEGMLPKITNAFTALSSGVDEVLIGHASDLHQNLSDKPVGTLIRKA